MLDGLTRIIAHVGYPTATFKSPMIYNPWFQARGVNAAVVPLGVTTENFRQTFPAICRFTNFAGALVTMPHKVAVIDLLDEVSVAVEVAGACNAVRRDDRGRLIGDMFDGEGFVRGLAHNGESLDGKRVLVVGTGGVGSAIAASAAAAGPAELALYDVNTKSMEALAGRLHKSYPNLKLRLGSNDPADFHVIVNATPLGMNEGEPLPLDVARLAPAAFVAEVVMKHETTPFLAAARARGCRTQVGVDMLFEQIPAYLDFFGFPAATARELRDGARISY
jgi:shikimate dehydrogenase